MELTPHIFAPNQRFASFLTRFLKLLLDFWVVGVTLNAFKVFRLIRLSRSPNMKSPNILLSIVAAVTMTFGVSTSSAHGQADQSGLVRAWGYNSNGQCDIPSDLGVCTQIAGGAVHTIAIQQSGLVRAWGYNYYGQCNIPSDLGACTQIAGGGQHTIAIQQSGLVRAWGFNDYGQCNIPSDLGACKQIAGGGQHTIAIQQSGLVRAWGFNDYGQCNISSDLGACKQIAGGNGHTIALRQDGVVRAWGYNDYGQCNVPSDLGACTKIAGGNIHTIALRQDGIVRAWGYNVVGSCNIPSDLGVCKQIAGGYHTIALQQSGLVRAWGYDVYGQCNVPSDLGMCTQIAGGFGHTIAIKPSNTSDVDGDGIPAYLDNCPTIANPTQADCDSDGIGDVCENVFIASSTANMGAFSFATPANGTIANCVRATGSVTVTITVVADLGNNTNEYATLKIGGVVIENFLFLTTGHDCPATPDVATLIVSAATWNSFVAQYGANVPVQIVGAVLVDPAQCASPFSTVAVRYGGPNFDCNGNGLQDSCEIASGAADCDSDGALDACEIAAGQETDIDGNGIPDPCQGDCNANGLPDAYELAQGLVPDCNSNGIPDSCDIATGFALDCNVNAIPDSCDIATGFSKDCNANAIPDSCDFASGFAHDCNTNNIPDSCDIASGLSNDVEPNGVPDECKADCNGNGLPDAYELAQGLQPDCNSNAIPDSCDIASGLSKDCNSNSIPDSCDIAAGEVDKDADGRPDQCEYDYGDFDLDGTIGGVELSIILSVWGIPNPPVGDINHDGIVNGIDLSTILSRWGNVPYGIPPLAWATTLAEFPDPAVVTDANLRAAITASGLPWKVRDNGTNIEMLLVPAGIFTMGCSASNSYGCNSDESPTHQVTLSAFYIGRYEVTQAQWTAKMGSNPSYFQRASFPDAANRPVESVSWNMIASGSTSFMSVTGLRLPTEAEWEYAYRAGTTTAFHSYPAQPTGFNDDTLLGNIAWFNSSSGNQTHAVGGKYANALGLHDMSGNVWEWCQDWYDSTYYVSSPLANPTGPATGSSRLFRGGGWLNNSGSCRASQRYYFTPDMIGYNIGFRVVRNP